MFLDYRLPKRTRNPGFVIAVHFDFFLFCEHLFIEFYVGIDHLCYFINVFQILIEGVPVWYVKAGLKHLD